MLRSFLTITFRILWRNKVTSFVNIFSLTIGITAFILIMLYVHHELRYDKFNENYERIYRLEGDNYGKLPPVIGLYVKDKLPEVENIARLAGGYIVDYISYAPADNPEDVKQVKVNFYWGDSTTFDVFTFSLIKGDPRTALKEPNTVVLTESTARKLFGNVNPLMKNIEFHDHEFMVTGIIKDIKKSHMEIDALFSLESIAIVYRDRDLNRTSGNAWLWSATYLLMDKNSDANHVEEKINNILQEINNGRLFDLEFKNFHIRPLKDIYFNGAVQNLEYSIHGNLKLIQILFAVAIFILVLACINYINLTTARASLRAKELGVKKVAGSSATLLRYQLIIESIIVACISFLISMTLVQVFLSKFNQVAMIDIKLAELNHPLALALAFSGVIAIGIIAGIYPAFYLTAIKPIRLIRGEIIRGSGGVLFLRALMTFQFSISIILIVSIIASLRQLRYIQTKELGFNKEQIITAFTPADFPEEFSLRETLKERLLQHPEIRMVSYSVGNPGHFIPTMPIEIEGIKRTVGFFLIDPDYLDLMGMEIIEGRNISWQREGDRLKINSSEGSLLFNETAIREFGIASPIGKKISWVSTKRRHQPEVIGIIKDFHSRSLHHNIEPLLFAWARPFYLCNIKISSSDIPATLRIIQKEWKNVYPLKLFDYQFLDETFDRQYKNDEQLATAIVYFTVLAIVIACMGLFALSSFMVSRRTKEIGIRKSMGASIGTIYFMIAWDFLKWILLAVIIACPAGWLLMNLWLEGFAYHIKLGADIFIIAALLALVIALLTVTWQSLKAAYANPVKALRYE